MALNRGDIAIDCTLGAGGHTKALLEKVGPSGLVIGIDQDAEALSIASERLSSYLVQGNLKLVKARFSELSRIVDQFDLSGKIQGICADIGVSSMHLDQASRGFSFQGDGPLDMRMDQSAGRSAADFIAEADEATLVTVFREFGEEPKARQIARKILETRALAPITSTLQLAELVKIAARYPTASRRHPATKVFQALRIVVNDELAELDTLLDSGLEALRPSGRFAVISFHSLEDRRVKQKFVSFAGKSNKSAVPRDLPITAAALRELIDAKADIIKPFPIVATTSEIASNPRSRSAKLRVITKL
ncbi:MAG: 16S rRNA (cytosine(1402)-N(4))-methyltransferase RsmH [Deltaproteobacteria bacterium]|nr:16S rRNA (cytosine(1402)-N(4))-methyltransferase RsmH [Deltaproteobacteria bacterium]